MTSPKSDARAVLAAHPEEALWPVRKLDARSVHRTERRLVAGRIVGNFHHRKEPINGPPDPNWAIKMDAGQTPSAPADAARPIDAPPPTSPRSQWWRGEWVPYFAAHSEAVAEIVAEASGRMLAAPRKLTESEELELLRDRVTREFGAAGARLVRGITANGRRR